MQMTYQLLGKGLPNIGNTCYVASIVQCLRYCKTFVFQLRDHDTVKDTPLIRTFIELLYASATKSIYTSFVHNLAVSNSEFRLLKQCDAHELYLFLIDTFYTAHASYNNMFKGTLKSCIECCKCNTQSITENPFISLSLEMGTESIQNIDDMVNNFFSVETLDGENKYSCETCKEKNVATKQLNISKPPQILVLQLKRFNGIRTKNTAEVEFNKTLQVEGKSYTLFAVCNHSGGTGAGHYTAACKKRNETWILCNDSFITDLNKLPHKSSQPYLLFYKC